jgi:hypothetical protein
VHDVFIGLHAVGHLGEGGEFHPQLMLRRRHFVVMLFRLQAQLFHHRQHFRAHVLKRIDRRDREIAALRARTVGEIAALHDRAGVVGAFVGIQRIEGVVLSGGPAHIVKDEEFRFRTEERLVANAGGGEEVLGFFRRGARVAIIGFA